VLLVDSYLVVAGQVFEVAAILHQLVKTHDEEQDDDAEHFINGVHLLGLYGNEAAPDLWEPWRWFNYLIRKPCDGLKIAVSPQPGLVAVPKQGMCIRHQPQQRPSARARQLRDRTDN
jgi:hypothetical protein